MKTNYFILYFVFSFVLSSMYAGELESLQKDSSLAKAPQDREIFQQAPYPEKGVGIGIGADFLYFGIQMGGENFATGNHQTENIGFDYNPGLRATIETVLPNNLWTCDFTFMYIHSDKSSALGSGYSPTMNVGNLIGPTLTNVQANSIDSQYKQNFYTLDILLGKYLPVSNSLNIKPYVGFASGYIDNMFSVSYNNCFGDPLIEATNLFTDQTLYYFALGLKAGATSRWFFVRNFALMADLNISALSSHFDERRKDSSSSQQTPNSKTLLSNLQNEFYSSTFSLDLFVGLSYWKVFDEKQKSLNLAIGWEQMIWFNMNKQINLNNESAFQGDLTLQGLTIKALFNF